MVINRTAQPPGADEAQEAHGVTFASVSYTPPDSMTDAEVAQQVKKLYKTVRELGS